MVLRSVVRHLPFRPLAENGIRGLQDIPKGWKDVTKQLVALLQLGRVVGQFSSPIAFSFGYGLGVFEQKGYTNASRPQIDMIHAVDNTMKFHSENIRQFGHHYSFLKYFPSLRGHIQNAGAGVYFNPYVTMRDHQEELIIKYGVVSMDTLLRDLVEWDSLYLAGRLQKPVAYLVDPSPELRVANQYNLTSAAVVGMLMLGQRKFLELEFYQSIVRISYLGDPRMRIGGENPNKVANIVYKQVDLLRELYRPIVLGLMESNHLLVSEGVFACNPAASKTLELVENLPLRFRSRLLGAARVECLTSNHKMLAKHLKKTVKATVAGPALVQTLKGAFTAGLVKSVKYAWEKKRKSWRRT